MAKLIWTKVEREGVVGERVSIIEAEQPPAWPADARLRVAGMPHPRIDGPERVTGRAVYTHDVRLPGMLYARILRSPHPHARIKHIETARALALPGVRAVISHLNVPTIPWWNDAPVFDRVLRFAGDEVAAVAADDEYIAQDALGLIDVEYQVRPFVLDPVEALRPGATRVHRGGNLVEKPRSYSRGDVLRGFEEADVIVERNFRTQSAVHNCMETHGAVASWNGDELTVWESTQAVFGVQEELAGAFHLPANKVRVICEYMGGGFGSKQSTGKWSIIAALLARQAGRPVHLVLDRHEDSLAAGNRAPTVQSLRMGARRDGTLTAIDLVATVAIGAYGIDAPSVEGPAQVLYACPNVRTHVQGVFTNTGPARSFRGPGYVEGAFPLESLMDELAVKLATDPLGLRLKNYARTDPRSGRPYSAKHLDECYRKGAEMIGWHSRKTIETNGTKRRSLGMASLIWGGGGGPPAYAWVRVNPDASVEVIVGSQDIGTGTRTVFAQIAAEELGISMEDTAVKIGDTSAGPYDPISWGSMTVSSVGPAVRQAAIDARNQLRDIAGDLLEKPGADIELRDGSVYVRGESQARMSLKDVARRAGRFTILGKGSRGPNQTGLDIRTFGVQFAEIEVDTVTGEVTVPRIVTVHDSGRIINPLGAANQSRGAVTQGIGYALTEGRVVDRQTGIVLNANLEDYMVPAALDVGQIDAAFINIPDNKANNLGAKGLGEPALIPTAPAIANALAHATGTRFTSLPITRDRVLEALDGAARAPETARE